MAHIPGANLIRSPTIIRDAAATNRCSSLQRHYRSATPRTPNRLSASPSLRPPMERLHAHTIDYPRRTYQQPDTANSTVMRVEANCGSCLATQLAAKPALTLRISTSQEFKLSRRTGKHSIALYQDPQPLKPYSPDQHRKRSGTTSEKSERATVLHVHTQPPHVTSTPVMRTETEFTTTSLSRDFQPGFAPNAGYHSPAPRKETGAVKRLPSRV